MQKLADLLSKQDFFQIMYASQKVRTFSIMPTFILLAAHQIQQPVWKLRILNFHKVQRIVLTKKAIAMI